MRVRVLLLHEVCREKSLPDIICMSVCVRVFMCASLNVCGRAMRIFEHGYVDEVYSYM